MKASSAFNLQPLAFPRPLLSTFPPALVGLAGELCRRIQFSASGCAGQTVACRQCRRRARRDRTTGQVPGGFCRANFSGGERASGSHGPARSCGDAATLWEGCPPVRPALSFQRVHQQLQVLRVFTRQRDPARDTDRRGGFAGGSRPQGAGIPQHPARGGRASKVCLQQLPGRLRRRPPSRLAEHLARSRSDGDGGVPSAGRGWGGRAGGLPGNLRPDCLCGHAHRRAEAEFRLAARDPGARIRRRVPSPGHQPALRAGRLAA